MKLEKIKTEEEIWEENFKKQYPEIMQYKQVMPMTYDKRLEELKNERNRN